MHRLQQLLLRTGSSTRACSVAAARCDVQVSITCLRGLASHAAAAAEPATTAERQADAQHPNYRSLMSRWGYTDVAASSATDSWLNRVMSADPPPANSNVMLDAFRRSNTSLPYLEGQMVKARVVAVDQHTIMLDPGYKYQQRFFKSELAGVPIYAPDGRRLGVPEEYRVGDVFHVKIERLETPFGDMQLSLGGKMSEREQIDAVLEEMQRAQESNASVMGRILNPVNRGYAVGVAGLVCFLPVTQCMFQTAQRIGVLQEFKVLKIKEETRNVILVDSAKVPAGAAPEDLSLGSNFARSVVRAKLFQPRGPRLQQQAPRQAQPGQ